MVRIDTPNRAQVLGDLLAHGVPAPAHAVRYAPERRVVINRPPYAHDLDDRIVAWLDGKARGSRRVSHPNVVRVFDHGVGEDGAPTIMMTHPRGAMLRELIEKEGLLPLARIRGLAWQLLDGLAAIHAAGNVHGDIKRDNITVDTTGGSDHLMIIDFGIARATTSRVMVGDDVIAGTPEYLAPELFHGDPPTVAADLYSAAIVIYELIAGVTPFPGGRVPEVLDRRLAPPIVFPAEVRALISPEVECVLLRALEREPERRFPDARGFAIAFDRAIGLLPGGERPARGTTATSVVPVRAPSVDLETETVRQRREELATVLAGGSSEPIIVAYLDLADALIADDRMGAAVHELEISLALLLARQSGLPTSVWRIEALLGAMYELLGNSVRARRAAMDAHTHAVRSGCKVAERSTRALLHRLMSSRRPLQRAD